MSAVCATLTSSSLVSSLRRSAAAPLRAQQAAFSKRRQPVTTSAMASSKTSISSYLADDTYKSMKPGDGDLTFLHTMLRVNDLDKTMAFFTALGLMETRRKESENGKFTLVFMASAPGAPEIELTYNWGGEEFAPPSRSMGRAVVYSHNTFSFAQLKDPDDIYALCKSLQDQGIVINRPPRDGRMAFVKASAFKVDDDDGDPYVSSPDGISVELLQKGEPLEAAEPWASMENVGEW